MRVDGDFVKRLDGYSLVTINVLYHLPDYRSILNEFIWQTLDLRPRYPRVEQFLAYWEQEIEGRIKQVRLMDGDAYVIPDFLSVRNVYRV